MTIHETDIAIVGTGAGGGTLAWALRDLGARVLLLERGDFLPKEPQNWSPEAVFLENRYKAAEKWQDARGATFSPGVHYFVGGNTKVYGAALPRLRETDFGDVQHAGGIAPAWPLRYADLEPYYAVAERLYHVHGLTGLDPTDPPRSGPFPYPPMPADPYMEELADRLRNQGLHPAPLPVGLDFGPAGRCIRCRTCDAFPCMVDAKGDADVCAVRPALASLNVDLWTRSYVRRLLTDETGQRVTALEVDRDGELVRVHADVVVVAAGAVNSAALLLRSANARHRRGLANGSDGVGRHYMVHNNTVLIAIDPARRNPTVFQKTVTINDWYGPGADPAFPFPMGNLQPVGKLQAAMLAGSAPHTPRPLLAALAARSVDWWVMSEDLPDPANRIALAPDGSIRVHWRPNNLAAHERLLRHARQALRRAGYPVLLDRRMGIETNSHQCGTMRFGADPDTSVLDPFCKAHEIDNLYVVDAGFFPSSTAVNPALTIAAQALRVGDRLRAQHGMGSLLTETTAGAPV
ncbi:MAG: GMC family oxidoreductase [Thermomicrobiales bacterium]|nr:GMC family oxidoreductase [Thermomicrobiales bacterium]